MRADGLELARTLPDGCLDLVYLDPPFGTGRSRRGLRGRGGSFGLADVVAFEDPKHARNDEDERPGRAGDSRLDPWLGALLVECRRLLRPGGALFLHLDARAAPRARLFLDNLLGQENFLNEIIWHYATGGVPRAAFARKHDTILYYRTGPGHTFHRLREKKRLAHRIHRPGVEEFRDAAGWYRYRFLDDVWTIPWLTQDAKERTGYPTQKPVALLERIVLATTDPGMRVADFCCGSGTTAVAARRLGRAWVACDRSELAIRMTRDRLEGTDLPVAVDGADPPAVPRQLRFWERIPPAPPL